MAESNLMNVTEEFAVVDAAHADRVALVTGGGRGIGAATVRKFARAGIRTCFTFLNDHESAFALALERGNKAPITAIRADATVESDVLRAFEAAESLGRLEIVVHNVGATRKVAKLGDWTGSDIETVVTTNLYSAILGCRTAVARWESDPHGRSIVNVSSGASRTGAPGEYVPYAAAKAGVEALTVGLAKEVAHLGIRVNAVAPGTTDTMIHAAAGDPERGARVARTLPIGRIASADEVANTIVWLSSGDASYVSGAVLRVTGGS